MTSLYFIRINKEYFSTQLEIPINNKKIFLPCSVLLPAERANGRGG